MTEERRSYLIALARKGNVKAFEELLALDKQKLQSFALSISGGNYAVAEDILQEAIIKAFRSITKFKGKSSFSSWLWSIIRNELKQFERNSGTKQHLYLEEMTGRREDSENGMETKIIKDEKKRNLWKIISQLPMKEKEVVTLVYMQEVSYGETADILNTTESAVKSIAWRARKKIYEKAAENPQLFK